jgi:DDB1- and CUL4-associated factor 7
MQWHGPESEFFLCAYCAWFLFVDGRYPSSFVDHVMFLVRLHALSIWKYISRLEATSQFRLAIGSYVEQYSNTVSIMKKVPHDLLSASADPSQHLYKAGEFDHPYPCTKILWSPDVRNTNARDLLATTGDYLRVWNVTDTTYAEGGGGGGGAVGGVGLAANVVPNDGRSTVKCAKECLLNNNKTSEYCAPLTSFDWNETDTNIVGTSSIDTTCTIWDIETQTARTQLIAHDREVFDLAFARGKDVFASVGADGSVRMFDLRSLEHSTIIYESPNLDPLLRLEWNKQDPNYLATFMIDGYVNCMLVFAISVLHLDALCQLMLMCARHSRTNTRV